MLKGLFCPVGAGAAVTNAGPMSRPKKTPRATSSTGGSVEARIGAGACARSGPAHSEVRTTTIPRRERFIRRHSPACLNTNG